MITKMIAIDGGAPQMQRARQAVQSISGVVAAEVVGGALKVWQGDELEDAALLRALEGSGIRGGRVVSSQGFL